MASSHEFQQFINSGVSPETLDDARLKEFLMVQPPPMSPQWTFKWSQARESIAHVLNEREEERRHRELVEATRASAKGGDVNITGGAGGGDVRIVGSIIKAGDAINEEALEEPAKKGYIKVLGTIAVGVLIGLIVAYFKGCWPQYLR